MKRSLVRVVALAGALALTVALAYGAQGGSAATDTSPGDETASAGPAAARGSEPSRTARAVPALATRVIMDNLDIPWDVALLPDGSWLVTERDRLRIILRRPDGSRRVLADRPAGFWAQGETGLTSIVADPQIATNHRFYTCSGFLPQGGVPEIRVTAWRLSRAPARAVRIGPLLTGIDIASGRHGGCRLRFSPRGLMFVGTGDSAVGTNPQDLHSLNGKVLRLNRLTGAPARGNPWANARSENRRFIYSYGHRNVQGLAFRPGDRMWSVEHGPDRDDEVNRIVPGGNYGWNPIPGYNEQTPMTDFSLPGRQIAARWRSGSPTIATSGATWVRGARWGAYEGTLAVCALKAQMLVFMKFDRDGALLWTRTPAALDGDFGRLRSVVQRGSGALLVTTSNAGGADSIVRVTPN